jgi:hypothetical protein
LRMATFVPRISEVRREAMATPAASSAAETVFTHCSGSSLFIEFAGNFVPNRMEHFVLGAKSHYFVTETSD